MKIAFVSVALIALGAQAFKAGQRMQPSQGTLQQDDQPEEKICTGFLNQSATDCWNSDSLLGIRDALDNEETQDMMNRVCDQKGVERYQKIPQTNLYAQCGLNTGFNTNTRGGDHCYSNTCIPPKGSVDDTTGAGAAAAASKVDETTDTAAAASKKSWVLDILTDFGEETDDEVMVTAACLIALKDNTMQLNIMFLDKDPTAQKKNLQAFLGPDWFGVKAAANIDFYSSHEGMPKFEGLAVSAKEMKSAGKKHYVLQVGPIHESPDGFKAYTDVLKSMPYSYALVGTMGNTLNSQRDAETAAKTLWDGAEKKTIVDTAKGRGAFKFSYSAMKRFFKGKQALLDHVVKIGFRNTVGRAGSSGGKFVANLVATQDTSANFQTVKSVAEVLKQKQEDDVAPSAITAKDTAKDNTAAINKVVNSYYDDLTKGFVPLKECDELVDSFEVKVHGDGWESEKKAVCSMCSEACFVDKEPPNLVSATRKQGICPACGGFAYCCFAHEAGKLNGPGNPTKEQVKDGYRFILKTLNEEFDVPIDLIVSGKPGQWEKTWDGIDKVEVPFKPRYSDAHDNFNDKMRRSFQIWTTKVEDYDLQMTPNYDSVGLIYALQEMHSGFSTDQFGCKDNNKGMNTCQLTSDLVNSPASFGNLLSPYITG
jgi:hypothetical protein